MLEIHHPTSDIYGNIEISGSKSESNRWLILQQLFDEIQEIENLSNSDDTQVLKQSLQKFNLYYKNQDQKLEINVGHAGTAMRFLTAYFAIQSNSNIVLTGSERMQQRPIAPLVDALNSLGCEISYLKNIGFPPLEIKGFEIKQSEVDIKADVSSQYITALMLIGAHLPQGLKINFLTELTSRPYVEMTKNQLEHIGIKVNWIENSLQIYPKKHISVQNVKVESDWSSASYWFSMVALSKSARIELRHFKINSLQGDAVLPEIYEKYFGVQSEIRDEVLTLSKEENFIYPEQIMLSLNSLPDIAQTIAVTCAGLKIKVKLSGLHTLKVKETDRLKALKNELKKIGVEIEITKDSLEILEFQEIAQTPNIETYQDHRMAMAFAPLALKFRITIMDENVVNKSYPKFWKDLQQVGFILSSR